MTLTLAQGEPRVLRPSELLGIEPESPEAAPSTDDELWAWIRDATGYRIPRRAVCPGHDAPFQFVADFYFHRVTEALILANRAGGKTADTASLHLANGRWQAPHEASHIGAIETQAKRCYSYYKAALRRPLLLGCAPDPHITETVWLNGSRIEILPGTEAQTQGGHPYIVCFDELEQGKRQPYENAKAMPVERWIDGQHHLGQFLATSTRVSSLGLMQRALNEAEANGTRVYQWCVFETMQPCLECEEATCPLWRWCQGRVREADGWRSKDEILALFRRSGADTWEAQHLCLKPEAKALIYAPFSGANLEPAEYIPGAGPLFVFYDWGFTDATHIDLVQWRDGVFYQFDELHGSQRAEREWVREIVRRVVVLPDYDGPTLEEWAEIWAGKADWPRPWPTVWPEMAHGDPSAVQMRHEFKEHGISALKPEKVKHNVETGQDVFRAAICTADGVRRYIIHPRCTESVKALGSYRAKELADGSFDARPDPDPANHMFSHACDSKRYGVWPLRRWLGLGGETQS